MESSIKDVLLFLLKHFRFTVKLPPLAALALMMMVRHGSTTTCDWDGKDTNERSRSLIKAHSKSLFSKRPGFVRTFGRKIMLDRFWFTGKGKWWGDDEKSKLIVHKFKGREAACDLEF